MLPSFPHFLSDLGKFNREHDHKNLLSDCKFYKKWRSDNLSLLGGELDSYVYFQICCLIWLKFVRDVNLILLSICDFCEAALGRPSTPQQ
jgi:hypothetical protein